MNRPVFNDIGLESAISFIAGIFTPFRRIVLSAFTVLDPLISILAGPARLIGMNRTTGKGNGSQIKK